MKTNEFNETLDSCRFNHHGSVLAGLDDSELLKTMAFQAMDCDDFLSAIRYLVVAKYIEKNQ